VHADRAIVHTSKMKSILICFIDFYSFVINFLANKNIKIEKLLKTKSYQLIFPGLYVLSLYVHFSYNSS